MDDYSAIRLECLRLASARQGASDPRDLKVIAEDLYGWVMGQALAAPVAPAGQEAGKPTGRQARGSAARQ